MKAAIYSRVSDDKLKDDGERRQDVVRQVERLKPYLGDSFNESYVFMDDDKSAFKDDYQSRPEFVKMLNLIRSNKIQKVYVETLDRVARRVTEGLVLLEEMGSHNCQVISIAEGEIDITSSAGWLRSGIFLLMAEWSSRDKSDKVKSAMERLRNDKRKICHSCGVVHLGRHPDLCRCQRCLKKG